jgi:glutamate racemase
MPDMTNTDKIIKTKKIGIFDSGIGGFSVLGELFKLMPEANYYYVSDDANAPYGPKSDEFITERSFHIAEVLINEGVELIVVACNTATAASIDLLREKFKDIPFVGVEPYLNAYYQIPEGLQKKMMVLTTESTCKSERFKRLKERLDPDSQIDHYSLKNLARLIEDYYYHPDHKVEFEKSIEDELSFLKSHHYAYAILGCTHYPLVRGHIEKILDLKAISPCSHVAQRVVDLTSKKVESRKVESSVLGTGHSEFFNFLSTTNNLWIQKKRESLHGPFKGK